MPSNKPTDKELKQALDDARYLKSKGIRNRDFLKAPNARTQMQNGYLNMVTAQMANDEGKTFAEVRSRLNKSHYTLNKFVQYAETLRANPNQANALRETGQWVSKKSDPLSHLMRKAAHQFTTPRTQSAHMPAINQAPPVAARAAAPQARTPASDDSSFDKKLAALGGSAGSNHNRSGSLSSLSSTGSLDNQHKISVDISGLTTRPIRRIGSFSVDDMSQQKRAASPRPSSPTTSLGSFGRIGANQDITQPHNVTDKKRKAEAQKPSATSSLGSGSLQDLSVGGLTQASNSKNSAKRTRTAQSTLPKSNLSLGSGSLQDLSVGGLTQASRASTRAAHRLGNYAAASTHSRSSSVSSGNLGNFVAPKKEPRFPPSQQGQEGARR